MDGRGGNAIIGGGGAATLDLMSISGPFNPTKTEDTPARQKILTCKPASARDEEPCARQILTTLSRRAYRGFSDNADVEQLFAIYKSGRTGRDFDTGIERALEALLSSPKFVLRIEQDSTEPELHRPSAERPGTGLAPVVLPVEKHPRRGTPADRRAQTTDRPASAEPAGSPDAGRRSVAPLSERLFRSSGSRCAI